MEWGRSVDGERDHQIHKGKSLCGAPIARKIALVEVEDDRRCKNCDGYLRYPGKEKRQELAKRPVPRTIYVPRLTYADWEAGL